MAKLPEIQEEMFFFEGSKGRKLLGFLHLPDAESITAGIIYSHPFAEEKIAHTRSRPKLREALPNMVLQYSDSTIAVAAIARAN